MTDLTPLNRNTLDRITHTVWGYRMTAQFSLGLPITVEPNTTLNERFSINTNAVMKPTDRLKTGFYCIGNLGHRNVVTSYDIHVSEPVKHNPTDAGLYRHLPFVLRPVGDDLSEIERQDYRLRRHEQINGKNYIAYYAKKFDIENTVRVIKETTINGVVHREDYRATDRNLQPQPPRILPDRVERAANAKIHVSTGATINFDERDVEELLNVARILYGDERSALISEIGIITGIDENYTSPQDAVKYTELKSAIISTFISTRREVVYDNDGFREELWIGEKTPLLISSPDVETIGA